MLKSRVVVASLSAAAFAALSMPAAVAHASKHNEVTSNAVQPTWRRLASLALKYDQIDHIEPLAKVKSTRLIGFFEPRAYSQDKQNVFEMQEHKKPAKKRAEARIKSVDPHEELVILARTQFNRHYNFKESEFPYHPFGKNRYYMFSNPMIGRGSDPASTGANGNTWPQHEYKIFFTNPGLVNGIKLAKKKAEQFLNSRTQNGSVDTTVKAKVFFHVTGFRKGGGAGANQADFRAQIDKVVLLGRNGSRITSYNRS